MDDKPIYFQTGYRLYCEEFRSIRKADFPNLTKQQIAEMLAEEWQAIDKSKAEEYQAAANKQNESFEQRVLIFLKPDNT